MTRLGQTIHARRRALGLTLQHLADAVGCSKAYLSAIENARVDNPPRRRLLAALEGALGITGGELARLADWQRTPGAVRADLQRLSAQQAHLRRLLRGAMAEGQEGQAEGGLDALWRSGCLHRWLDEAQSNVGRPVGVSVQVPLINRVAAGYPSDFTDLDYPTRVADEYVSCADVTDPQAFAARVIGESMLPDYREGDIIVFAPGEPAEDGADCFVRLLPDHDTTFKRVYFEDDEQVRLQPLNPAFTAQRKARRLIAGLYPAIYRIQRLRTG